MRNFLSIMLLAMSSFLFSSLSLASCELNDREVKQRIIDESISGHPGTCACPFNIARDGSQCGGRSAWSRPGGNTPICFQDEVTEKMMMEWRKKNSCKSVTSPAVN